MDRRGDSRGRDLEINMPGLCDQWDMSGKVKEKLLLISWHLVHSKKKKKREREREIALTTYLKGILKSSSYFNTLKITNQEFCNMESQRTLIPIG